MSQRERRGESETKQIRKSTQQQIIVSIGKG